MAATNVNEDSAVVFKWGVLSRVVIFALQVASNNLLPDHSASMQDVDMKGHRSPQHDAVTEFLFGGFDNWDSEYFVRIATHGYADEEQTLAFFPLYPLLIRAFSATLFRPLRAVASARSRALITGVMLNFSIFPVVVVVLFLLTRALGGSRKLSFVVTVLYCFNPASVFMSAAYTETLFALWTFSGMLACQRSNVWLGAALFSLATATRSNGVVLCGYLGYHHLMEVYATMFTRGLEPRKQTIVILSNVCTAVVQGLVVLFPFLAFQYYGYHLYCSDTGSHSRTGALDWPSFCSWPIPIPYTYVQDRYWNIGFLRYFQWKQVPNFLLASPMVALSCYAVWRYLMGARESFEGNPQLRPFVVHLSFLLVFGIFNMHVQVLTRFIVSSSPVVFWCGGAVLLLALERHTKSAATEPRLHPRGLLETARAVQAALFPNLRSLNPFHVSGSPGGSVGTVARFVVLYFLLYLVLGTVMHCNFLPWT